VSADAAGGVPTPSVEVEVRRWQSGRTESVTDEVADEQPVSFLYRGIPHVVMLASPSNLDDLAVGFTLSEEIVAQPAEIRAVEVGRGEAGFEVRIDIAPDRFSELLKRQRNLAGRTGCGLCGAATVADAIRSRRWPRCPPASRSTRAPVRSMPPRGSFPGRASRSCARTSAGTTHSTS
jgi:formate dehydrogenase assembly factor FdhD